MLAVTQQLINLFPLLLHAVQTYTAAQPSRSVQLVGKFKRRQLMSAEYLNNTVSDKHHREITNLNVLVTDTEAVIPSHTGDSCWCHVSRAFQRVWLFKKQFVI